MVVLTQTFASEMRIIMHTFRKFLTSNSRYYLLHNRCTVRFSEMLLMNFEESFTVFLFYAGVDSNVADFYSILQNKIRN